MSVLRPALSIGFTVIATLAVARTTGLSGAELSDLVAGATIEIDTPLGTRLPVRYGEDGRMSGQARGLASYLGSNADNGRWWVAGDQICHKWDRWFNADVQCLRVKVDGNKVQWARDDGTSGTATITSRVAAAAPTRPAPGKSAPTDPVPAPSTRLAGSFTQMAPPPKPPAAKPPPRPASRPAETSDLPPEAYPAAESMPAADRTAVKTGLEPIRPAGNLDSGGGLVMMVANVAASDVLNVRTAPSPEASIVGAIPPDSQNVLVVGPCEGRWCPVKHRDVDGWVNSRFLAGESDFASLESFGQSPPPERRAVREPALRESRDAPRTCLSSEAKALLEQVEAKFGRMQIISTCRPGARIAGTGRISKHASGNAVDFDAGSRKAEVVAWLVANHHAGGTMTYPDMNHVHMDIGPHFVSLAGQRMARRERPEWGDRMSLSGRRGY